MQCTLSHSNCSYSDLVSLSRAIRPRLVRQLWGQVGDNKRGSEIIDGSKNTNHDAIFLHCKKSLEYFDLKT
jgi:hypothetical protein